MANYDRTETELLAEALIDGSADFEENKYRLLRMRGFRTDRSFSHIDSHYYHGTETLRFMGMKLKDILTAGSIEPLLEMFRKDGVENQSVSIKNSVRRNLWANHFAGNLQLVDVEPDKLEPFVARLVRALNRVGCYTFYSCDGWHEKTKGDLLIKFDDRNSALWCRLLMQSMVRSKCRFEYVFDDNTFSYTMKLRLPMDDAERLRSYIRVNETAARIEENEELFRKLRSTMIRNLKGVRKNPLSLWELYALMEHTVKQITGV